MRDLLVHSIMRHIVLRIHHLLSNCKPVAILKYASDLQLLFYIKEEALKSINKITYWLVSMLVPRRGTDVNFSIFSMEQSLS